jgi:hypothetical protein
MAASRKPRPVNVTETTGAAWVPVTLKSSRSWGTAKALGVDGGACPSDAFQTTNSSPVGSSKYHSPAGRVV